MINLFFILELIVNLLTIVLKVSVCIIIALGIENAFAGKLQPDLTCPNAAILKNATPVLSFPYKYQKASQEMGYFSLSLWLDPDDSKAWLVLLNPVHGKQLENVQLKVKSTLEQLVAISDTPSVYQAPYLIDDIEDEATPEEYLQFCFYNVTGNPNIEAAAVYFDDDEEDTSPDNDSLKHKFQHNKKFHQKIMILAKKMQSMSSKSSALPQ